MINDITLYYENFTLHLTYEEYIAKFDEYKVYGIRNEFEYFPIPYVNEELLINTIEILLIDIIKNDNKQHNIYANGIVKYIMREQIKKEHYYKSLNDGMSQEELFYETN